jgi:hypothetical protein
LKTVKTWAGERPPISEQQRGETMNKQFATTQRNIQVLGFLPHSIHSIVESDPNIICVYSDCRCDGDIHLDSETVNRAFFHALGFDPDIHARDDKLYNWRAEATVNGTRIFCLLNDDDLLEFGYPRWAPEDEPHAEMDLIAWSEHQGFDPEDADPDPGGQP